MSTRAITKWIQLSVLDMAYFRYCSIIWALLSISKLTSDKFVLFSWGDFTCWIDGNLKKSTRNDMVKINKKNLRTNFSLGSKWNLYGSSLGGRSMEGLNSIVLFIYQTLKMLKNFWITSVSFSQHKSTLTILPLIHPDLGTHYFWHHLSLSLKQVVFDEKD